ncbi:S41 family peptidase [Niameybacter sp.]|uniref:S41 family peptidase n=1 Tax=Niameybacter sp. TaxID=2033640 RepID=UPI003FA595F1
MEWVFNLEKEVNFLKGTFSGKIYTIINSKTGSSAENAVGYSKCIKNNVLIGENTCGMGLFGEVQAFALKNSFIVLGIPSKNF